jgi:putative hydrolase of the HAD superfamily
MAAAPRIKLLTFDLDDTLWECAPVILRAEQVTYAWLQQYCPRLTQRFSMAELRERRLDLARRQPELAHRFSALRRLSLVETLRSIDIAEAETLAEQALAIFLEARHGVELFDEAEAVLAQLSQQYLLGAITNGNVDVKRLSLNRYFSLAINAEHLPRAKPHPEPFLAALAQAGCTAEECIHIGDDIEHDIRAAQRLGFHAIWVNREQAAWPHPGQPDAEIRHIGELPNAIQRLVSRLL